MTKLLESDIEQMAIELLKAKLLKRKDINIWLMNL